MLKKSDVIDYLGTTVLSMVSFNGIFMPLSIGFIEKRADKKEKRILLYMVSVLIVILKFSIKTGLQYLGNIIILVSIFGVINSLEIKNERMRINSVFISTLINGMLWSLFNRILAYDVFAVILTSIITTLGFAMFNLIDLDFNNLDEKGFMIFSLFLGVLIGATDEMKIYFLEVKNILAVYMVLNLAYFKGAKFSVIAGLIIGTVSEFSHPHMGISIISLTLGGLIASLFKKEEDNLEKRFAIKNKVASVMGFCLGNSIIAYYITGYNIMVAKFAEIIIAGLLFIISNKKIIKVAKFINDDVLLLNEGYKDNFINAVEKIQNTSGAIGSISDAIAGIYIERENKEDIFDMIREEVCVDCKYEKRCWEDKHDTTIEAIYSSIEELDDLGKVDDEKFQENFNYEYCNRKNKILNEIENKYKDYKLNKGNITFNDLKNCMVSQLKGISKYLLNITTKVKEESTRSIEESIAKKLEEENVVFDNIIVDVEEGEAKVEIKSKKNILKDNIEKVNLILSKVLNKRIENTDKNYKKFSEVPGLKVRTGVALARADGQRVSGDNYKLIDFCEEKYIMILSDGMGTGEKASYMSNILVDMFSDMVKSEFDSETITTLIGSFMQYISDSEKIITLDSTSINLNTGECEFVKVGGAPSFIIRKDSVDIISSNTMPLGIFENVDFYKDKTYLRPGDIIISVSDGVMDSKRDIINKEYWISGFLKELMIDDPQIIADELLNRTKENYNGQVLDDITIIVQKIMG